MANDNSRLVIYTQDGREIELGNPQSRIEAILENMLGANNVIDTIDSRVEQLLSLIAENGGINNSVKDIYVTEIKGYKYLGSSNNIIKFLCKYGSDTQSGKTPSYNMNSVDNHEMLDVNTLLESFVETIAAEYKGCIYGSNLIQELGLVLLGDFSQGGNELNNPLSDSIDNYSGIILQGIYQKTKSSSYNTSILYINPEYDIPYYAGMKDRNNSYACNVTFNSNNTCNLSGNNQVMIYGII